MEFKNDIKPKEATPENVKMLGKIKQAGFMFGSVRFGCKRPVDEDWLIRRVDWDKIVGNDLGSFCYLNADYDDGEFQCFFLQHDGTLYNFIIPWDAGVYEIMVKATRLMCRVPVHLIQVKHKRIRLFEAFKELLT